MTSKQSGGDSSTRPAIVATAPPGWLVQPVTAFDTLVGPIYFHSEFGSAACGFLADGRHANRRGVVHGGMICTAFDVGLGVASRPYCAPHHQATLQLSVQFVSGMMLGEFAVVRSEIIRATRSVTFVRGVMTVDDRLVATAEAIFKRLHTPVA